MPLCGLENEEKLDKPDATSHIFNTNSDTLLSGRYTVWGSQNTILFCSELLLARSYWEKTSLELVTLKSENLDNRIFFICNENESDQHYR